jgi:hypothetical protein
MISQLQSGVGRIQGTLCVYGDWFGRPMDNCHRMTAVEGDTSFLKLTFSDEETLEIWDPQNLTLSKTGFSVQSASRVLWRWFYYGRPHLPENRFFIEHTRSGNHVGATSNVTWYSPHFNPSLTQPAVAIH